MAESHPGELFAPMFVVHLMPGDVNAATPPGLYECPFYKTNLRAGHALDHRPLDEPRVQLRPADEHRRGPLDPTRRRARSR